ncbi:MAG: glycerophosphodiester phosphodiesterase family protein [Pirellulales bacterium]|nr:glycerophosphodiester phosphodiesterase family protein [Pirellulales bacterium]
MSEPRYPFFEPLDPPRRCQVIAHRGAGLLAPPNSPPAIEQAIGDLCEWIEIDVRLTRDGQHVLCHAETVDACSDGHGRVADLTWDEIKRLDTGAWFAKRYSGTRMLGLSDCLSLTKGRANLWLDCKQIDPARLLEEIHSADMERQVLIAAPPDVLRKLRELSGGRMAVSLAWSANAEFEKQVDELRPAAVEIAASELSRERVAQLHARGVRVIANCLGAANDCRANWLLALANEADLVQTDLPEEFLATDIFHRERAWPVQFSLHRGALRYAPENTLPAYDKGVRLGAHYQEFDVRSTLDQHCYLLHDATLNRTTSGEGPISQARADAIERLDAGGWFAPQFRGTGVPSLDDFLAHIQERSLLYFDAKAISPEHLARALERHKLTERAVVFQGPQYLARLRRLAPTIRVMPPLYRADALDALVERLHPYALDVSWEALSAELIRQCHDRGVRVFADAMGETDRAESHLQAIEWGIDLIQTDRPTQLYRAVELYCAKHPQPAAAAH